MKYLLFVALGGAGGAVTRYLLGLWAHGLWAGPWPLGTFMVNVLGSAGIGVVFVLLERGSLHPDWRSVLMVGFLGAFTTFSTFSLETVELWQGGQAGLALAYALVSVLSCVLAVAGTLTLLRAFS
ncbi:fluoride efflux transporter CrcB [Pseudohaliea rubra]|uniref:Fluoride-specific ion channel FluC n=1 Tax=Pseudohaliea rubra DSM 19751 TaxID=1265313 RepID=A0A095VQZ4_9GAMM|nr:fluoride efflux transporter CrcB [Pseudohaliea rubra]KGE03518.1 CrcB protein [Pseudohaliea rubra DSM 19751]